MKLCSKCQEEKSLSEFNKSVAKHDGLQTVCRVCTSSYYRSNMVKHKANVKTRRKQNRKFLYGKIIEYLTENPCVDCGESDIVVLEFDHVRGVKKSDVSSMISSSLSWETIEREIQKCDVRCCNCHRRKTARQFDWTAKQALVD